MGRGKELSSFQKQQAAEEYLGRKPLPKIARTFRIDDVKIYQALDELEVPRWPRGRRRIELPNLNYYRGLFLAGELSLSEVVQEYAQMNIEVGEEAFRRRCHFDITLGGEKIKS